MLAATREPLPRIRPPVNENREHQRWVERRTTIVLVVLALAGAVIARLVRHLALHDVPHVQDEITYQLQAHTYALGELTSRVLFPRAAFNMWFVDDRAARFGIFPPGWPMLLALGTRTGLESWVNPILHGITALLVGRLALTIAGQRKAIVATALYAFCPQAIVLAASLMSHTLVALCAVIVASAAWRALRGDTPSTTRALAAGGALAMVACTRPLCMVVLAAFLGGCLLRRAWRERALPWKDMLGVAAPLACGVALVLTYNGALTGRPFVFPQNDYFNEHLPPGDGPFFNYYHGCNNLGFGRGCDYSIAGGNHTLENAASNVADNWGTWIRLVGGGPLVFAAALFACTRRSWRPFACASVLLVVGTVAAYSLYWHPGTCYGARFYHLALPTLVVAGALGVTSLRSPKWVGALLVVWLGWNAFAIVESARELSHRYWGTDDRYETMARDWKAGDAVVMIAFAPEWSRSSPLHWTAVIPTGSAWALTMRADAALAVDEPNLEGKVVFVRFHPGIVDQLKAEFPGRSFYVAIDHPEPQDEELIRYEDWDPVAEHDLEAPNDNFEGFMLTPPRGKPWKKAARHP